MTIIRTLVLLGLIVMGTERTLATSPSLPLSEQVAMQQLLHQAELLIDQGKAAAEEARRRGDEQRAQSLDYQVEQVMGCYGILQRDNFLKNGNDHGGTFARRLASEVFELRRMLWPSLHNIRRATMSAWLTLLAITGGSAMYTASKLGLGTQFTKAMQKFKKWLTPKPAPAPIIHEPEPPIVINPIHPELVPPLPAPELVDEAIINGVTMHHVWIIRCQCGNLHLHSDEFHGLQRENQENKLQICWDFNYQHRRHMEPLENIIDQVNAAAAQELGR